MPGETPDRTVQQPEAVATQPKPATGTADGDGEQQPPSEPAPMANGHAPPDPLTAAPKRTFTSNAKRRFQQQKMTFKQITKPPGGFDPTPLPDVPPGYTVKFTFHRAKNLPVADLHTGSSDPFVKATLSTNPPNFLKRHKEDPDLVHRTRPVRKCLDPEWDEEWIVANVPASGFKLKCRLYDEDYPAKDDRLGNVTVDVHHISKDWNEYAQGHAFNVKKRSGNKSVYFFKTIFSLFSRSPITPTLWLAIEVLGKSDPPHGKMYTVGPTGWVKHFSPMIGRMIGTKVNKDEGDDMRDDPSEKHERITKKYDFQANEMQLSGPVPPKLYHRYVEFRPLIGLMFSRTGMRGRLLNGMLHNQHRRIYNFDSSTEYGTFDACSEEASVQFLRMAHFDEGWRMFTYVLTLDGMFRFTETGKEFGIDMLSKHSMHSDVATYIACSGEFFVRRETDAPEKEKDAEKGHRRRHSRKTVSRDEDEPRQSVSSWKSWRRSGTNSSSKSQHESSQAKGDNTTKKSQDGLKDGQEGGISKDEVRDESLPNSSDAQLMLQNEHSSLIRVLRSGRLFSHTSNRPNTSQSKASGPPPNPSLYRLFIDNDSGTYRPDKSILPDLQKFFQEQFPGLNITVYNCDDEELTKMKKEQREMRKSKGVRINMVLNRSPSASSFSSSDESRLDEMEAREEEEDEVAMKKTRDAIKAMRKGKGKAVEAMV